MSKYTGLNKAVKTAFLHRKLEEILINQSEGYIIKKEKNHV